MRALLNLIFRRRMLPPLISVIGATGTGKSALAVSIALACNGEIINADAMQCYSGLPIITNQHPISERHGVPHHLLSFMPPTAAGFKVTEWVARAEEVIAEIRARGKTPIVVGGTHYYVQALLWPGAMLAGTEAADEDAGGEDTQGLEILDADTPTLYSALQKADPLIAAKWHPNDRRKIRRSLEIYLKTGRKPSEIYAAQQNAPDSPYRNLILWVGAETEVLRERLDARVDKMLLGGMWEEIRAIAGISPDSAEEGVWQSIGFKEFRRYLEEPTEAEWENAVRDMKTATRQYARLQIRWIRIKLLNAVNSAREKPPVFLLDSTDIDAFKHNVEEKGVEIAKVFLAQGDLPDPLSFGKLAQECLAPKREFDVARRPELWVQKTCEVCETTTTNTLEWAKHLASGRHKKKVASRKKKLEVEKFLREREEKRRKEYLERTAEVKSDGV